MMAGVEMQTLAAAIRAESDAGVVAPDDGAALMRCLRIPNLTPAREACLQAVEMQIAERATK